MFRYRLIRKLTSIFVTAFICLNVGGAMCVAYCQSFGAPAESSEHCPLKKVSKHCNGHEGDDPQFPAVGSTVDPDCCPMTVSFFAGPVEKNSFSTDAVTEVVETKLPVVSLRFKSADVLDRSFNYRGPPLDRRVDRLKHCIIRI